MAVSGGYRIFCFRIFMMFINGVFLHANKKSTMNRKLWTVGLLLSVGMAFAQSSENEIEEVTITGKILSTPYSKAVENIIVIDKKQIQSSPATSIEDLLQQFSGIDIRRRGANGVQSDVSIRGGSFEQVLVLINGVRINDAQTGHNTMNIPVDLGNVEKIEVIKGPAARKFGNNAFSGVINIITKASAKEIVKISANGGDFTTYGLGLSATFGSEKVQNLFQINTQHSEGYRHNTDYDIRNAFYQSKWNVGKGNLNIQAGFVEKKFGANGFYASPKATEQYEETQASIVSVGYDAQWKNVALSTHAFWRRGQDMYTINRQKPEIYRNMSIGNNVGATINAAYTSSLGITEIGVAARKEYLNSNNANTFSPTNISIGERERFITEAFAEHKFSLFDDQLTIIPGISWASIHSSHFFYPGIDVGYRFMDAHKIFGNVAKVNRVPSFFDLYYISGTELGNPNLLPENALSYELGYQYLRNKTEFKASYFVRDSKNGIDWVKENATDLWTAKNVGNLFTQGVDVELSQRFSGIAERFSVGYTYLDTQIQQDTNFSKYLAEHFRHQVVATWEAKFGKYFSNQLTYRYQERIFGDSYQLLDTKFSFQKNHLTIYTLINNLTNVEYKEAFGVPMPRRWFHVGFSYQIPL